MTFLKKSLLLVALLTLSLAQAQEKYLKSAEEARALSKKASELFKDAQIGDFFDALKPYWPLPDNELDLMAGKTLSSLNVIEGRFGKQQGIVKVKEETITDTALRETYLVKYEFHAIRLVYTYYKNNKGWILNGFAWDDKYTDEFK